MSKKQKTTNLAEQLRAAFAASGMSRFAWAKQAGVSYGIVHRFCAADRDIVLSTASKLAGVLGLELRTVSQAKRKR
jgi:ribosome-binding protein aMBF1 (putative translation factor)